MSSSVTSRPARFRSAAASRNDSSYPSYPVACRGFVGSYLIPRASMYTFPFSPAASAASASSTSRFAISGDGPSSRAVSSTGGASFRFASGSRQ